MANKISVDATYDYLYTEQLEIPPVPPVLPDYYIVYGNGGTQSLPNATTVQLTGALWNGVQSSSGTAISYSNATFTVNTAGLYLVTASCTLASAASSARRFLNINCSDGQAFATTTSLNGQAILWGVTSYFWLAAGTIIRFQGSQDTGGALDITTAASPTHKIAVYKLL